jgi:hypothetical protein
MDLSALASFTASRIAARRSGSTALGNGVLHQAGVEALSPEQLRRMFEGELDGVWDASALDRVLEQQ